MKNKKNNLGRPKDVEKRQAIVEAAKKHFLVYGFELANMDKIAAAAGVSKQTIYGHFENKDELFKTVISQKCQESIPDENFFRRHGESPEKGLLKIAHGFVEMVLSPEILSMQQLITAESSRYPKIAQLFYTAGPMKRLSALADYLRHLDQEGLLKVDDPFRAAGHFFSLLKGMMHFRMTLHLKPPPSEREKEEHIRDCVALFLRAYRR